jgi:hypothetical protein
MKLFKLPKLGFNMAYFKDKRNWYHVLVGIAIGYFLSVAFFSNRNYFPLSFEYFNNYLYPFLAAIGSMVFATFWEKRQDKITGKSVSDIRDIFFTGFGGLLGGYITMVFASWRFATLLIMVAVILIIFKHKK